MAFEPPLLLRRQLDLPISAAGASKERLETYLAQVERPLAALLARERLNSVAPGDFIYQSNPYQILQWQVVPTLKLRAGWEVGQLEVRSTSCRLMGFPAGMESLGFTLEAVLGAEEKSLGGWAEVGLHSRLITTRIGRHLGSRALEAVLDRIERRVNRGLRRDLGVWLGDETGNTAARG
jgi:hypothetical protein